MVSPAINDNYSPYLSLIALKTMRLLVQINLLSGKTKWGRTLKYNIKGMDLSIEN